VEAKHLQAPRDGEEKNRRRKEHANVMVCKAYCFETGRGGHSGYCFRGTQKAQPECSI
jgi:hypothetical protein